MDEFKEKLQAYLDACWDWMETHTVTKITKKGFIFTETVYTYRPDAPPSGLRIHHCGDDRQKCYWSDLGRDARGIMHALKHNKVIDARLIKSYNQLKEQLI